MRYLRKYDGANQWRYRVHVPRGSEHAVQFEHNTGANPLMLRGPDHYELVLEAGQYDITIDVVENLLKPNEVSTQTFTVYVLSLIHI